MVAGCERQMRLFYVHLVLACMAFTVLVPLEVAAQLVHSPVS